MAMYAYFTPVFGCPAIAIEESLEDLDLEFGWGVKNIVDFCRCVSVCFSGLKSEDSFVEIC